MEEKLSVQDKIRINVRAIKLIRELVPWNFMLDFLMAIVFVCASYWWYFFLARFIDDVMRRADGNTLLLDVVIMIVGDFILQLLCTVFQYYYFYCGSNIWELSNTKLNEKIMEMDYQYMESESVQNSKRDINLKNHSDKGGGINTLFWNFNPVVKRSLHILVAFAYILNLMFQSRNAFSENPWEGIAFILCFLALTGSLLALNIHKNKQVNAEQFRVNDEMIPYFREYFFYTEEYICMDEATKDIRVFHQQNLLSAHIGKLFVKICEKTDKMMDLEEENHEWMGITEGLISCLIYFLLGMLAMKRAISVGSICLYAGCISNFLFNFHHWVRQITLLSVNAKYLKSYFDFLDIPNQKYEGTLPIEKRDDDQFTMEFRRVSFRYPGTDVDVLKDFSVKFHIGERLAVVGKNGSGKTTFIKLLCRLYDPTQGEILLNGIDIRKYNYQEYMALFSVVFQDFQIPAFSLGQNVAAAVEYDEEKAELAIKQAGLEELSEKLPQGLETCLYTDFDSNGVDISGGEAQKVAIARALYHDTPFIILDEPTAALDPLAEYEVYSKFDELVGTKTAVYISHRLSSCQFCNDILVIDGGKAVQRGSHEKLVQDKEGLYYTLWNTQAQYYQ